MGRALSASRCEHYAMIGRTAQQRVGVTADTRDFNIINDVPDARPLPPFSFFIYVGKTAGHPGVVGIHDSSNIFFGALRMAGGPTKVQQSITKS